MQLFYYIDEMENNYIKRENVENNINIKNLIEAIRNEISQREQMDDDIAMDIIVTSVFKEPESATLTIKELHNLIKKIFFKIRSKLSILTPLIEDDEVSEIMVNGHEEIFFEKNGVIEKWELSFDSERELEEVMQNIASQVHREINELNPIVDARLQDGSRVNGVYKNIAVKGPTLTIRKFSDNYMKMEDLIDNSTLNKIAADLLKLLVKSKYNLFVSGGTSSGKTTLLNTLGQFIGTKERVIVIEDSTELKLNYIENLVQLECRYGNIHSKGQVTMARLIKSSLRMRPDRIIVGEVRGEEVLDMIQAMNTGHAGSLSTGHGNSVEGMLKRLETMYLMAMPLDIEATRSQIAEAIDMMIHIEKLPDGRKITEISELVGYENGKFNINKLMAISADGVLAPTGNHIKNISKLNGGDKELIYELQSNGIIPI